MLDSPTSAINTHLAKQDDFNQINTQFDNELTPLLDEVAALIKRYEDETGYDFKSDAIETLQEVA